MVSWPGILVSHKETRSKVFLARKLGKQGYGSSPGKEDGSRSTIHVCCVWRLRIIHLCFQIFDFKFITQSSFAIGVKTCHKKSYNFPSIMKTLWNKRVSSKLNVKFDLLKQKRNIENEYLTTGITYDWGAQIQCSRDFGPSFRITIGKYQGSAAEWNDDNNFIGSPSPGQCCPPAQSPENIVFVCLFVLKA